MIIVKYLITCSINKYKARLIVKGFHQRFKVDYYDTFIILGWIRFNLIQISLKKKRTEPRLDYFEKNK